MRVPLGNLERRVTGQDPYGLQSGPSPNQLADEGVAQRVEGPAANALLLQKLPEAVERLLAARRRAVARSDVAERRSSTLR